MTTGKGNRVGYGEVAHDHREREQSGVGRGGGGGGGDE